MGLYTVNDICDITRTSRQTVLKHLKSKDIISKEDFTNNRYLIDSNQLDIFLYEYYPKIYRQRHSVQSKKENAMVKLPPPTGNGRIVSTKYKGVSKYYIYNLPIGYDDNCNEIYYSGKPFSTKKEAIKKRNELIRERKKKTFIHTEKYCDFCINYINSLDIKETTKREYTLIVEKKFRKFFGDTEVSELSRRLLQDFLNKTKSNVHVTLVVLRGTILDLYQDERIPRNFYEQLKKPKQRHVAKKNALTKEQIETYFDLIKGKQCEIGIKIMFLTGIRIGECMALKYGDIHIIDSSNGYIDIQKTAKRVDGKYIETSPKTETSKRRVYFYDPELARRIERQPKNKYLLSDMYGRRYSFTAITYSYFKKFRSILGMSNFTPHIARVTYTSHALENGVSEKNIQDQLGHTNTILIHKIYGKSIGNRKEVLCSTDIYGVKNNEKI